MMTKLIRTNSDNPDFQKLTKELDVELCRIYNTKPEDYEEYNRITNLPTVVLIYQNDEVVGCGCFRKFDDQAIELKRMYVKPAFRGKGIATAMVNELELWGKETGTSIVVLETGTGQPEAIALYRKLGYSDAPEYLLGTDAVHSICLKKLL